MFRLLFLGFFLVAQPLFAASFANAQFVMDLSNKDFRAKTNVYTLGDIAVGELGLISGQFCQLGENLFTAKNEVLLPKKMKYSLNIEARREPNNLVSIVATAEDDKDRELSQFLRSIAIQTIENCPDSNVDDKYFKIKSINGVTKLTDLFNTTLQ